MPTGKSDRVSQEFFAVAIDVSALDNMDSTVEPGAEDECVPGAEGEPIPNLASLPMTETLTVHYQIAERIDVELDVALKAVMKAHGWWWMGQGTDIRTGVRDIAFFRVVE